MLLPYHDLGATVFDKGYLNNLNKHDSHYKAFSIEKQNVIQTFYHLATLDIYNSILLSYFHIDSPKSIRYYMCNSLHCIKNYSTN